MCVCRMCRQVSIRYHCCEDIFAQDRVRVCVCVSVCGGGGGPECVAFELGDRLQMLHKKQVLKLDLHSSFKVMTDGSQHGPKGSERVCLFQDIHKSV